MDPLLHDVLDILKFIIPALVVLAVCYVIINKVMDDHANRLQLEIRKQNASMLTPLKLQAYERMILFLERISPQTLINNYNDGSSTARGLKHLMESSVNQEYMHNLSQQIYISNQAWNIIKVVKEEVIQLIHETYENMHSEANGVDLSKAIIDRMIQENSIPTIKAIDFLKAEINLYF
jgi:ribosomal protein S25